MIVPTDSIPPVRKVTKSLEESPWASWNSQRLCSPPAAAEIPDAVKRGRDEFRYRVSFRECQTVISVVTCQAAISMQARRKQTVVEVEIPFVVVMFGRRFALKASDQVLGELPLSFNEEIVIVQCLVSL